MKLGVATFAVILVFGCPPSSEYAGVSRKATGDHKGLHHQAASGALAHVDPNRLLSEMLLGGECDCGRRVVSCEDDVDALWNGSRPRGPNQAWVRFSHPGVGRSGGDVCPHIHAINLTGTVVREGCGLLTTQMRVELDGPTQHEVVLILCSAE